MTLKRLKASIKRATPTTGERAVERADGWKNLATELGVTGVDARMSGQVVLTLWAQDAAEELWRADDIAARIVESVPNEMTREGWCLKTDGTEFDVVKPVLARADELNVDAALNEVLRYRRAYGGGALLLGADDGQRDWGRPLFENRVRSLDFLTPLTPRECMPVAWYEDFRKPKFGQPRLYLINPDAALANPGVQVVHESRLLVFQGNVTSRRMTRLSQSLWGDSIFTRVGDVIRDFQNSFGSSFALLKDFAQAVLKIKGLAELVASEDPEDQNRFRARVRAFDFTRSSIRTALLDSEEDYERKATPMTGLPDMLDRFILRMAAAADMPVSLLMGQAPAGLNATGDSDIRWFYDRVRAMQRLVLKPQVSRIVKLIMTAQGIAEPEGWTVAFNPLWQLTGEQIANQRKTAAETDRIYFDMGVLSPQEIRDSRFGQDEFGTEIELDAETEAALRAEPMEESETEESESEEPEEGTTPPAPRAE